MAEVDEDVGAHGRRRDGRPRRIGVEHGHDLRSVRRRPLRDRGTRLQVAVGQGMGRADDDHYLYGRRGPHAGGGDNGEKRPGENGAYDGRGEHGE